MKASYLLEFKDEFTARQFENWIEFKGANLISMTIIPDDKGLYDTDPVYKAMVKANKKAKREEYNYLKKNETK